MADPRPFHALVPLKTLNTAKSRLATGFGPAERIDLVHRMLRGVVQACHDAALVGEITVVVEGEFPDQGLLPPRTGLLRQDPGSAGLNDGLRAALDRLGADRPGSGGVAIVMADLPHLTAEALDAALALLSGRQDAMVVADQHGEGTSLLAWTGAQFRSLRYGEGSRRAHLSALRRAGFDTLDLPSSPAFQDLDTLADLGLPVRRASPRPLHLELAP